MVHIGSLISTLRSSLLIKIVIELRDRDAQRRTTYFRSCIYMLSLIERERRQPQLKIIYFEAHYPSSFFKTMTCQTVRRYRWVYICLSFKEQKENRRWFFLEILKKKKRLIEFSVFDSILFLSFFFLLVYIYIYKYRFSLFPSLLKKSTERIEKLMTLKSSAERTSEQARTITFVDKEGGERERTRFLLST